jgi:hypothetical protein
MEDPKSNILLWKFCNEQWLCPAKVTVGVVHAAIETFPPQWQRPDASSARAEDNDEEDDWGMRPRPRKRGNEILTLFPNLRGLCNLLAIISFLT